MKFVSPAAVVLAAGVQAIDLSLVKCPDAGVDMTIEVGPISPHELPDSESTVSMKSSKSLQTVHMDWKFKEPLHQPELTFIASFTNPGNPDAPISLKKTFNLCEGSPLFKLFPKQSGSPGITFPPADCDQNGDLSGWKQIKFDIDPGDGHVSVADLWQGPEFSLAFSVPFNDQKIGLCAMMKRDTYSPYAPTNILPAGAGVEMEVSYCPWDDSKSKKCKSAVNTLSAVSRPKHCKADHYRLTMQGDELLLIAVDENEKFLGDPSTGAHYEPHNFDCSVKGLFDNLYDSEKGGVKHCLQVDENNHMTLNPDDETFTQPCAYDEDNCHAHCSDFDNCEAKPWVFRQALLGAQRFCMQDVPYISSCKHVIKAADFFPYGDMDDFFDMNKCSTKWKVRKVFHPATLGSSKKATSCSDCEGTFQCFTSEEGCTTAASQAACEGLGTFDKKGKWTSDGEWCPSPAPPSPPSPPKTCKGKDSAVHFTCMGATRCCGSGTLTPSCIDYDYNSCCVQNGIAIACAKGQQCGVLASGSPTCLAQEEFV